jgi:hypothetical protein
MNWLAVADMSAGLSSGHGWAGLPAGCGEAGPVLLLVASLSLVGVSRRRAVMLICAGWVPQDGLFGWNATAGLRANVATMLIMEWLFIA